MERPGVVLWVGKGWITMDRWTDLLEMGLKKGPIGRIKKVGWDRCLDSFDRWKQCVCGAGV